MLKMKSEAIALAASAASFIAGCSTDSKTQTFYVLFTESEAVRYYNDMIGVVSQHGLTANPGTATDERGYTLYAVEGKGRGVRVWSVNVPMSEREAIACGLPKETPNYPTQHVVTVSSRGPFMGDEIPTVSAELKSSLSAKGYEIRTQPRLCNSR